MEEVEGLSVAAIDWIIAGIQRQGGQVSMGWWNKSREIGCTLGSTGARGALITLVEGQSYAASWKGDVSLAKARRVGLANVEGKLTYAASEVSRKNTGVMMRVVSENMLNGGVPNDMSLEGGRRMIEWLQAQRDMKCSGWTPPIKEVVPARKREAVLA